MKNSNADFLLSAYDYELPAERIAQFPAREKGNSRLLVMDRFAPSDGAENFIDATFEALSEYLPPQALIIANNSRVLPARMTGLRKSGGKVEFLLLTPLPLILENTERIGEDGYGACVECLLRPSARIHAGESIALGQDLEALVREKSQYGKHKVFLSWKGSLEKIFASRGSLPLPPYIRRKPQKEDADRYQTVYAQKTGSVAAPTAGLHFTSQIKANLINMGFEWREITLYVGYGTFSPVRSEDIRRHQMHAEYVEISREAACAVTNAKMEGRPVIAVGTTSVRSLEGVFARLGKLDSFSGWIDIFLYPGKKFNVADALITNFHLPQSTLLMLVSAFAGRERILEAYGHAIRQGYNFFSYGDAMLIR